MTALYSERWSSLLLWHAEAVRIWEERNEWNMLMVKVMAMRGR